MSDDPNLRPRGIPVSRAILLPPGPLGDELRPVLAAIDRVHGDGVLPRIAVAVEPSLLDESAYEWAEPAGIVLGIALRPDAEQPRLNLLHEVGHFLDHQTMGQTGAFASIADPALAEWRETVATSDAIRTLRDIAHRTTRPIVKDHAEYHLRLAEQWARCYAQFITLASRDPQLRDDLMRRRSSRRIPVQWDDDDFLPIAGSMVTLFRRLGWMT